MCVHTINTLALSTRSVIQIVQFLILLSQAITLYNAPCLNSVRRGFLNLAICQDLYFIYAFSSFYVKNYLKASAIEKTEKKQ